MQRFEDSLRKQPHLILPLLIRNNEEIYRQMEGGSGLDKDDSVKLISADRFISDHPREIHRLPLPISLEGSGTGSSEVEDLRRNIK